jgi:hypothetical protein
VIAVILLIARLVEAEMLADPLLAKATAMVRVDKATTEDDHGVIGSNSVWVCFNIRFLC